MEYKAITEGVVGTQVVPPELIDQLTELEYDHGAYFDLSAEHLVLATDCLVASRARPKGIVNANKFMRLAAEGQMEKRAPISVRRLADGFWAVVDGNSTYLNALHSNWPDIPCSQVS